MSPATPQHQQKQWSSQKVRLTTAIKHANLRQMVALRALTMINRNSGSTMTMQGLVICNNIPNHGWMISNIWQYQQTPALVHRQALYQTTMKTHDAKRKISKILSRAHVHYAHERIRMYRTCANTCAWSITRLRYVARCVKNPSHRICIWSDISYQCTVVLYCHKSMQRNQHK